MKTDARPKTLRVVLFVVFSLASLAFLYALVFRVDVAGSPGIRVQFDTIGTIQVGSPVRKSGVKVGSVNTIQINEQDQRTVFVTLSLYSGQIVRQGDKISIASGGILGDQYIEIYPGPQESRVLLPGELVIGDSSLDLRALASKGESLLNDLGQTSRILSEFLVRNQKPLDHIVSNVEKITTDTAALTDHFQSLMTRYEKDLTPSIEDFKASLQNLKVFSQEAALLGKSLNSDSGVLNLLSKETTAKSVEETLENVRSASETLKKVGDELEKSFK